MDFKQNIEHIADVERNLRELAAALISSGPAYDSTLVTSLLRQSENLFNVQHSLLELASSKDDKHDSAADYSLPKVIDDSQGQTEAEKEINYPISFVYDERLYRIGFSKQKNERWWKSVACDEAYSIMEAIYGFLGSKFRISEIKKATQSIEYRIDVVLTALKEIGAIEPIGKQGFNTIKSGTPSEWLTDIKGLPVRKELLSKK